MKEKMSRRKYLMSPLRLLQEIYRDDPWKIMVCCIMLNQTSGKQVHQVIHELFYDYPDPIDLTEENPEVITKRIKLCGFGKKRAETLIRFSEEYIVKQWHDIDELYGIGEYASDSYRIFVLDDYTVVPQDKELKKYMSWLKENNYKIKLND